MEGKREKKGNNGINSLPTPQLSLFTPSNISSGISVETRERRVRDQRACRWLRREMKVVETSSGLREYCKLSAEGRVVLGACHSECKAFANQKETKQLETKGINKVNPQINKEISTEPTTRCLGLTRTMAHGSGLATLQQILCSHPLSSNYTTSTGAGGWVHRVITDKIVGCQNSILQYFSTHECINRENFTLFFFFFSCTPHYLQQYVGFLRGNIVGLPHFMPV